MSKIRRKSHLQTNPIEPNSILHRLITDIANEVARRRLSTDSLTDGTQSPTVNRYNSDNDPESTRAGVHPD